MNVQHIMTQKPHIINENATLLEAVKKMTNLHCGILPVGEMNHIVGVITDRDIITRAFAQDKSLSDTLVKNIMTKNIVFCEEDDSLEKAIHQMNGHSMRRVLIKNKKQQLAGILSLGDIIRRVQDKTWLAGLFKEVKVG